MSSDLTIVQQVNAGLQRWYEKNECGDEYEDLFINLFEENGFDAEDDAEVREDLASGLAESQIIDFFNEDILDGFPYGETVDGHDADPETEEGRKEFIFKLIHKICKNPNISFDSGVPEVDEPMLHKVTVDDLEKTKKVYAEQVPVFWKEGMDRDTSMLHILAIGHKYGFDYLLNLADEYARCRMDLLAKIDTVNGSTEEIRDRINKQMTDLDKIEGWCRKHAHFKKLKNIPYKKIDDVDTAKKEQIGADGYYEVAKSAVSSFFGRIMPMMLFTPLKKFNSDLRCTVMYMTQSTAFVQNLIQINNEGGICPFQYDMAIACGKPFEISADDDDSDDDDVDDGDDADEKQNELQHGAPKLVDDIEAKLKSNNLKFVKRENIPGTGADTDQRCFQLMFNEYSNGLQDINSKESFMRHKRLIAMVDRRKDDGTKDEPAKDMVFMYQPPEDSGNIPHDALAEWYIGASRMCILPDIPKANGDDEKDEKKDENVDSPEYYVNGIGVKTATKGMVLTLSFHVKAVDEIKMYLYCHNQILRFYPEDIKVILPVLFNMDYGDNKDFLASKKVEECIESMKRGLIDRKFKAFQNSYK